MPDSCTAREILVHDSVRLFGLAGAKEMVLAKAPLAPDETNFSYTPNSQQLQLQAA